MNAKINSALLAAFELGYIQAEKGINLQLAIENFKKDLTKNEIKN